MPDILVVCTGNLCRSPLAEAFLRGALDRRFGDRAPMVASAGVIGVRDAPAMPETVRAAAERGADVSAHRARRLSRADVADADVVVAMAAEHRDEVARLDDEAAAKTFTLKELVRLVESLPPSNEALDLPAIVALADARRGSGARENADDEDVVDPLGMPFETYRAVAWELDEWSDRLAAALARRQRATATTGAGGE